VKDPVDSKLEKQREICFFPLHPDPHQARSAQALLSVMDEISHAEQIAEHAITVRYQVDAISLEIIESLLEELGFHLETTLFYKLTRSLYYYTEQVQRDNLGIQHGSAVDTKSVFINRYNLAEHGCRDSRPPHLRQYS